MFKTKYRWKQDPRAPCSLPSLLSFSHVAFPNWVYLACSKHKPMAGFMAQWIKSRGVHACFTHGGRREPLGMSGVSRRNAASRTSPCKRVPKRLSWITSASHKGLEIMPVMTRHAQSQESTNYRENICKKTKQTHIWSRTTVIQNTQRTWRVDIKKTNNPILKWAKECEQTPHERR